jgi:probable AcnD-accessory protein PrpF
MKTVATALRIPAVYMRGGTSKGVFFHASDLPADPAERDAILLRVIGSPDRYGKQIDGMGGASSSTSKVVLLARSPRPGFDVDYLFGQVAIDAPLIDWSGNCGNLTAAVGPFAISEGLVNAPADGLAQVRIWQANIGKGITARVPMRQGQVQEDGDFVLDGVAFAAAEIALEFDEAGVEGAQAVAPAFPTGRVIETLQANGRSYEATLINAGNPTIFVDAQALGLTGTELQEPFNSTADLLERCERLRARGAVVMGIAADEEEATRLRRHTPKLAFVAAPQPYTASDGTKVAADRVDLVARIISMGKLHHAMTGTGAIAIAAAANIPGTVVHRLLARTQTPRASATVRFGHPSGVLEVGASSRKVGDAWVVEKVTMSRSARRLMEGFVRVPAAQLSKPPA